MKISAMLFRYALEINVRKAKDFWQPVGNRFPCTLKQKSLIQCETLITNRKELFDDPHAHSTTGCVMHVCVCVGELFVLKTSAM